MGDRVAAAGRESVGESTPFADAMSFLEQLRSPVALPGLERIADLVARLGHPERSIPVVHVTGTNGKGSTSRLIESALRAAGLRTGIYTSPHLEHVSERIVINGLPIDEQLFAQLVATVRAAIEESGVGERPTHFEALTAVGLLAFNAADLDALVFEAGIGGRIDATNVADGRVAVVTNVALDHTEVLGTTRRAIAAEKAGIIKAGATAVIGETDPEVRSVIEAHARAVGAVTWRLGHEIAVRGDRATGSGRQVDLITPFGAVDGLDVPFHGRHQAVNAAVAIGAIEAFTGAAVDRRALDRGWRAVTNRGRFEVIDGLRTVVVDVAHNPHGVAALIDTLDEEFPGRPRVVVVGVNPHKDAEEMLVGLLPGARAIVTTEVADGPSVPATVLGKVATALGVGEVHVEPHSGDAVATAFAIAAPGDVIVLTGSHYWIGEVRGDIERVAAGG